MGKVIEFDYNEKKFRKNNGEEIQDLISYINEFYEKSEDMRIIVGCDSKQRNKITIYSLVVVLYDNFRHNGAHVINLRFTTPKERDLFTRLFNEGIYCLNLGLWLDKKLSNVKIPLFTPNEYDKSVPIRKIELHVDINPKEKYKSNIAYNSVMGMLCGYGFLVKAKHQSFAASSAADYLAK